MATDLSQEAAMRKLRSTPVVRSKEPMPAETRMEIIELVQTNVDKVSTIIAVFLSSLHTILAPVSSNRDPLRLTSSFCSVMFVLCVLCFVLVCVSVSWKMEQCARGIKEGLDRKFGQTWHVCVGEGFGFNVTHQAKNMLHLYYGHVGVVCFKC